MPTIHLYGDIGKKFSEGNFAAFVALCARIGAAEVLALGDDYFGHFYALGNGILVNYDPETGTAGQVRERLAKAGIKVFPYTGRITLGHEWELEMLDYHLKDAARAAAGQHLIECPSCHRAIGDGKFCPYCGAKCNPHLRRCPACKMGYPSSFARCTRCGGTLELTREWVFDYTDPEDVFDGVYLSDNDARKTGDNEEPP